MGGRLIMLANCHDSTKIVTQGTTTYNKKTIPSYVFRCKTKKVALAGNRTRIACLEGRHSNHYTTNACESQVFGKNTTVGSL